MNPKATDKVLMGIAKAADSFHKVVEGDYQKDGLWYCGKCNTAKQTETFIAGLSIKPMCRCKCAGERLDAEERAKQIEINREICFDDPADMECTFALDDRTNEVTRICRAYAEKFPEMLEKNKGLVLFGETGVGKTFAANALANELIDNGYKVRSTSIKAMAEELKDFNVDRARVLRSFNRFDLLILDDWGTERGTEWMSEIVQEIVDSRYKSKKPFVLTTNIGAQEMKSPADLKMKRLVSRLYERCVFIEVKGKDRRRAALIKDDEEMKKLLGIKK